MLPPPGLGRHKCWISLWTTVSEPLSVLLSVCFLSALQTGQPCSPRILSSVLPLSPWIHARSFSYHLFFSSKLLVSSPLHLLFLLTETVSLLRLYFRVCVKHVCNCSLKCFYDGYVNNSNVSVISMLVSTDCPSLSLKSSWLLVSWLIFPWNLEIWGMMLWDSGSYLNLLL